MSSPVAYEYESISSDRESGNAFCLCGGKNFALEMTKKLTIEPGGPEETITSLNIHIYKLAYMY